MRRRKAFTLVELLVVIGTMVVLIAIPLAVIRKAIRRRGLAGLLGRVRLRKHCSLCMGRWLATAQA